MRISTILFLALFAGIFGSFHRSQQAHRGQAHEAALQAPKSTTAVTRSMERELGQLSHRLREADRSVRSLEQAARRLQDLLRQSSHSSYEPSNRASLAARRSTQREVEAQLAEVLSGRQQLLDEKEHLIGRQAVLQARLEMARAGLLPADEEQGIDYRSVEKPSPLEALTTSRGQTRRSTVLVVR